MSSSANPTILLTGNSTPQTATLISEDAYYKYYVYAFRQNIGPSTAGTIQFPQTTTCDILLVGGGGGGSGSTGSSGKGPGGGAGAVVFITGVQLSYDSRYTFVIGNGGTGGANVDPNGGKGANSGILYNGSYILRAEGGGGAGGPSSISDGGSGGGQRYPNNGGSALNPGSSIYTYNGITGVKYGNNGGNAQTGPSGGGGAGARGNDKSDNSDTGANGGIGVYQATVNNKTYNFAQLFGYTYGYLHNDNIWFGGGGGSGGFGPAGSGGIGGGGSGRGSNGQPGYAGGANTGGGGGGVYYTTAYGGDGGSGIIIIRYAIRKTYTLTYDLKGASTNNSITVGSGAIVTLPSLQSIGYTFLNWTINSDGTGTQYNGGTSYTMPLNDVTLYAQIQDNTIAIGQAPAKGIAFSDFQNIFGGTYPIALSEYRTNIGIPTGAISISACKGKTVVSTTFVSDTETPTTPFYKLDTYLVAWYQFDDFNDSSDNKYNLISYGARIDNNTYVKGLNSLLLNYNNAEYVGLPTIGFYNIATIRGLSIAFWFKLQYQGGGWWLFNFSNSIASGGIHAYRSYQTLTLSLNNNEQTYIMNNVIDNSWHHLVWCISSTGTWTIYLDCVNQYISKTCQVPNISYSASTIGLPWNGGAQDGYAKGNIDDLRIYSVELSYTEVFYIYNF